MIDRRAWLTAALGTLLLLVPAAAQPSRIHYESIALEQLVRQSELVVIAAPAGDRETVEVKIGEGAPPFRYGTRPFRVTAVLKGELQKGEKDSLRVSDANLSRRLSLHRRYYIDKVSKSPIYRRYEPAHEPEDGARILFLRRAELEGRATVQLTVLGAVEHVDQRAAVAALTQPRGTKTR